MRVGEFGGSPPAPDQREGGQGDPQRSQMPGIILCRGSLVGHGTCLKNTGYRFDSCPRHITTAFCEGSSVVERLIANEKVAGSIPVPRSRVKLACEIEEWKVGLALYL